MIIKSVAVIYFSPTGTTKDILYAIAKGMDINSPRIIDITFPNIRNTNISSIDEDMLIIGVPVYEERIPKILYPFLNTLKGNKKPVVLVAVYGNIGDGIVLN
ncbi:MAG: flavodoxin domain-containing protein, partial [Lutisporaceae bacterium]